MEQDNKKILPYNLQKKIIDYLNYQVKGKEFENWLFETPELNNLIKSQYLELITLDYPKENIKSEVQVILNDFLDYKNFEIKEIIRHIEHILHLTNEMPHSLKFLYHLSCHNNYFFLRELENSFYSLAFEVGVCYMENWVTFSENQRLEIIYNFKDNLFHNCKKVIKELNRKEVVFEPVLSQCGEFYEF